MGKTVKLFLIRHGEKTPGEFYNPELRILDQPLSENGLRQSRDLVELFRAVGITGVYASRYSRAQETARPLAESRGLEVKIDPRLDEINAGDLLTMTDEEIGRVYPGFLEAFRRLDGDLKYPGGESGQEVMERFSSFLEERAKEDGIAAAFTHEGLMRVALCAVMGIPVWKRYNMRLDYCGIMELEYDPDHSWWRLHRFNYTFYRPFQE